MPKQLFIFSFLLAVLFSKNALFAADDFKEIATGELLEKISEDKSEMFNILPAKNTAARAYKEEYEIKEFEISPEKSFFLGANVAEVLLTAYSKPQKPFSENDENRQAEFLSLYYNISANEIINSPLESYVPDMLVKLPYWHTESYPIDVIGDMHLRAQQLEQDQVSRKAKEHRAQQEKKAIIDEVTLRYFVQIGSFASHKKAEEMALKAKDFGDVYYAKSTNNNIIKVLLGPYEHKDFAQELVKKDDFRSNFSEFLIIER